MATALICQSRLFLNFWPMGCEDWLPSIAFYERKGNYLCTFVTEIAAVALVIMFCRTLIICRNWVEQILFPNFCYCYPNK